jgi:glycosyltransferase involved in cell wall biosynthesis
MPDSLISICIPAYKAEYFIGETLASIRAQTFADWEVIVVEDGSHDGTEEIVRAFAETVSQPVVFLRHDVNRGLPGTRNTAIGRARSEWIALIDADDLWTPDHLERAINCAQQTGADLVHTGVIMFESETGRDLEKRAPSAQAIADFPRSLFTGEYTIQPSSVLLRRDVCRRVGGFDPNCRYVEDREFWLRLVRAGAKVRHDSSLTCRYRQHAGAMTKNAAAMAEGVANVFERNADWDVVPRSVRRERAASAWSSAGRIVLRDNPSLARAHFRRALRHQPWSLRLLFFWCVAAVLGIPKGKSA